MCVYSMIVDHYVEKWEPWTKPLHPYEVPHRPYVPPDGVLPLWPVPDSPSPITREELEEFRRLLERAREYDRRSNEPDWESEEKKEALRKLADQLGMKIDFLD